MSCAISISLPTLSKTHVQQGPIHQQCMGLIFLLHFFPTMHAIKVQMLSFTPLQWNISFHPILQQTLGHMQVEQTHTHTYVHTHSHTNTHTLLLDYICTSNRLKCQSLTINRRCKQRALLQKHKEMERSLRSNKRSMWEEKRWQREGRRNERKRAWWQEEQKKRNTQC